ncbi:hypothetical protein FRX31_024026, partial [Thalictrum thalictroides]
CKSGGGCGVSFGDYIANVGKDIPIAVVVGNLTSGGVANYLLDATVNVSQYKLTTAACVGDVVLGLGKKFSVI